MKTRQRKYCFRFSPRFGLPLLHVLPPVSAVNQLEQMGAAKQYGEVATRLQVRPPPRHWNRAKQS